MHFLYIIIKTTALEKKSILPKRKNTLHPKAQSAPPYFLNQTPVSSFRAKREIFVIRGEGLTLFPHLPRTSPLSSSVFHLARTLSGSFRCLPHRGRRCSHFSPLRCISPTLFHTASALSAPTGHLPLEGKADDTREACHRRPSGIAPYIFAAKPPPQV